MERENGENPKESFWGYSQIRLILRRLILNISVDIISSSLLASNEFGLYRD